jgi:serine/threonine protein kinase
MQLVRDRTGRIMPLATGSLINNRYRIVRLLGQGGFGAVYRAWDTSLERPCAIKENLGTTEDAQRQFKREARILANVVHPNLPRVTDHFIIPGQGQYLVMDFVEGEDLQSMIDRTGGPLPTQQVLHWIGQVCDALSYLHSQKPPIIHRDIKPANIRITPTDQAMLVDFGIAKIYDAHSETTVGARAVTPGFSPPEQYGKGTTDARSDVYALGATLFALLTGKVPDDSVNLLIGGEIPKPTHVLNQQVPINVSQAIEKAMQVDRSARFENIGEFKSAFMSSSSAAQQFVAPVRGAAYVVPGEAPIPPTVQVSMPDTLGSPYATPSIQTSTMDKAGSRRKPWLLILGGLVGLVVLFVICLTAIVALGNTVSIATDIPTRTSIAYDPTISSAYLALDQEGDEPSTVFQQEDDRYAIVEVSEAPEEIMLKAIWIAKSARGMEPNAVIDEYEMAVKNGVYWIKQDPNEGALGAGSYLVELYLDDELKQTIEFELHTDEHWLENLYTALDQEGTQPTTVFSSTDMFYIHGDLVNAPEEVSLKIEWTAVEAEDTEPYKSIGEYELTLDEGGFWFSLTPKEDSPWPVGIYQAEFFIDGELANTIEFQVR